MPELVGRSLRVSINPNRSLQVINAASTIPWSVHMYEPDPELLSNLHRRVASWPSCYSYEIHDIAVSDVKEDKVTMFFPDRSKSAVQPHPHGALGKHVFQWKKVESTYSKDVKVTTLDEEFVQKGGMVDILKIDVEGHDVAVLRGGKRMLEEVSRE